MAVLGVGEKLLPEKGSGMVGVIFEIWGLKKFSLNCGLVCSIL